LLAIVLNYDFQRSEKLGILWRQAQCGIAGIVFGRYFLMMHSAGFSLLVETDRNFEDKKKVVACCPNPSHHLRNCVGIGERLVNSLAQFLDQALEIVVQLQKSPFPTLFFLFIAF